MYRTSGIDTDHTILFAALRIERARVRDKLNLDDFGLFPNVYAKMRFIRLGLIVSKLFQRNRNALRCDQRDVGLIEGVSACSCNRDGVAQDEEHNYKK